MDILKSKILIVEDSFIVALHLKTTLESEGYQVLDSCPSGEEALEVLSKEKPSLVLMDIMIKGDMDGIETAAIIKEKYGIPIIYISALSDKATIKRAKLTQPYGFLIKPFEDRAVFTTVEMAIHKHEMELKLRQSEQRFTAAVHSINDAIIVVDTNCCITFYNASASAIMQRNEEEIIGKPIGDVLHLKDATTNEVLENPIQCSAELHVSSLPANLSLISKDGSEIYIGESSLSLLSTGNSDVNGLVISFRDITEKRQQEELLKNADREKTAALIQGQENERSRIARDLHDGLGQMLNAIKMNASVIAPAKKSMSGLYTLIDEAIQECVRISENLLPSKLNDFDLGTCLKSLCEQLDPNFKSSISFKNGGTVIAMNHKLKINLYRIAQEAINNAIKHADAKNIVVSLKKEKDVILLSIHDDGDKKAALNHHNMDEGHGLTNMSDRAKMMGGRLSIGKTEALGWLIEAKVPFLDN
jgi:PAS domain S-box-containing protein